MRPSSSVCAAVMGAAALLGTATPARAITACVSNADCPAGLVCEVGYCLQPASAAPAASAPAPAGEVPTDASATSPQPAPQPTPQPSPQPSPEPPPQPAAQPTPMSAAPASAVPAAASVEPPAPEWRSANIHLQLTGGTELGTYPTFEFGSRVTGLVRARLPFTSFARQAAASGSFNANRDTHDFGLGGGIRWYITGHGGPMGLYIGQTVEFINSLTVGGVGDTVYEPGIVSVFEFGYRWIADGSILFGVGTQIGGRTTFSVTGGDSSGFAAQNGLVLAFTAHLGGFM